VTIRSLRLRVEPGAYAICRILQAEEMPAVRFFGEEFFAVVTTAEEVSLICPEHAVREGVRVEHGWRLLKFDGVFGFDEVGVLASVLQPLAQAGIGILAASTFNTDYVLVKAERLEEAIQVLSGAGHSVLR
jgi:hypothetical protein